MAGNNSGNNSKENVSQQDTENNAGQWSLPSLSNPKVANFPIVGIGASAGGLEAFTKLLSHLPPNTGMAFVVVQHLDPTHESFSSEIFSRATQMPVSEVQDGMEVERNHVYVIPPNQNLALFRGRLSLIPRTKVRGAQLAIDFFFRSLAEDQKDKAIGVILSGTASDGTEGLKVIKAEGGITIAQKPETAKYDSMPRSAILSGFVDLVLSPEQIAQELVRIAGHDYVSPGTVIAAQEEESQKIEPALNRILVLLRNTLLVDFTYYKHSTIRRRIDRRMVVLKIETLDKYAAYLHDHREEIQMLYADILIHVTGFFRDSEAFKALKTEVIPTLFKLRPKGVPLRVWIPGCSTGEEVYSIAICIMEFLGDLAINTPIQIFGSDISEQAIEKARLGEYSESLTQEISKERLNRFFTQTNRGYRIVKSIREMCLFSRHDVTSDPPFAKIDLISCRNVLIYFGPVLQKRVIPLFHYALNSSGFLWLGRSETIGSFANLFTLVDKTNKIYTKKITPALPRVHFPTRTAPLPESRADGKSMDQFGRQFNLQKEADRLLQSTYAPPSVVINDEMEIQLVRGRMSPFLEVPQGQATHNLLKMVRPELLSVLRMLVQSVRKKNAPDRKQGLKVNESGKIKTFDVQVTPIKGPNGSKERYYLIVFERQLSEPTEINDIEKREPISGTAQEDKDVLEKRLEQLQQDITAATEYQQSIVEEYETSQEELTSSNEELQSANEELQSTCEELETAKEELQSANEELCTVNEELQNRNTELVHVNNDLTNLLGNTEIPILIIGGDRKIRRFTPKAARLWNLIDTDLGRDINDIKPTFEFHDLDAVLSDVIQTITSHEVDVQDRGGHWYRIQVRPYKTVENKIDGAVVSLLDIDTMKRTLDEVQSNLDYVRSVVETVQHPLAVMDQEFKIKSANRSFYEGFRTAPKIIGTDFFHVIGGSTSGQAKLRTLIKDALNLDYEFKDFEIEGEFQNIGHRILLFSGRRISRTATQPEMLLLAIEDLTERRRMEAAFLRESANVKLLEAVTFAAGEAASVTAATQIFLDKVCEYTRWPVGHAYFATNPSDSARTELVSSTIWHLEDAEKYAEFKKGIESLRVVPGVRLPGQVFGTKRPAWVTDAANDPSLVEGNFAKAAGIRSVFAFPVLVGIDVVAVLEFFSPNSVEPDFRLLEVMARIGPQLGRVVERVKNEEIRAELFRKEKEARTEAEKANRAKDLFLATLSHELRTPLSSILTWAQLIRMGKLTNEDMKRGIETIEQSAKSQSQLIDDLLDVSRIMAGKFFLNPESVDVNSLVRLVVQSVQPLADKKPVRIVTQLPSVEEPIVADPVRIKQIVWNLLTNAIKFTPPGGKVSVEVSSIQERDERRLQIKVADTGRGIHPDFLSRIFVTFSQWDNGASRKEGGLGLGLAIVRNLVESQGGTVKVDSPGEGKGSTFTVTFPSEIKHGLSRFQAPHSSSEPERRRHSESKPIYLERVKILIIEDEPSAREAYAVMLRSYGAIVQSAKSVSEALAVFPKFDPDVLVCDIALPEEDGYSLIRKVRGLKPEQGGNVPAIALTAYAAYEDVERALAAGFQVHLPKPVDSVDFASIVSSLVKRK